VLTDTGGASLDSLARDKRTDASAKTRQPFSCLEKRESLFLSG
jgi:hypothetical protein